MGARLADIEDGLESHQSRGWEELATEREQDDVLEKWDNLTSPGCV